MVLATAAHHAGHVSPVIVFLIAVAAAAGWSLSVLARPLGRCPRCRGTRVRHGTTGKRFRMCKRCSGTGLTRRIGATAVHRFYWSVLGERARARRLPEPGQPQDRAPHPGPPPGP